MNNETIHIFNLKKAKYHYNHKQLQTIMMYLAHSFVKDTR